MVQRQTAIEPSAYQQSLEKGHAPQQLTSESVRYWSDFNRVYFHPKSIVQLDDYELGSTLMPFEKWSVGEELFGTLDKEHDVLDRDLRPFAEEADQLQGIQLIASLDDAWGGFAARYMDRLRDEYGKTTIWVWGLEDNFKNTPRVSPILFNHISMADIGRIFPGKEVSKPFKYCSIRGRDITTSIALCPYYHAIGGTPPLRHNGSKISLASVWIVLYRA